MLEPMLREVHGLKRSRRPAAPPQTLDGERACGSPRPIGCRRRTLVERPSLFSLFAFHRTETVDLGACELGELLQPDDRSEPLQEAVA